MLRMIAAATLSGLLLLPSISMADTAADKFGRGLAGMTTGFLELPGNIVAESRDRGGVAGATIGVAKGIGMIPVRELVGVFEFVTAPFPVPDDYEPVLHPEYPWDYFEGSSSARAASYR